MSKNIKYKHRDRDNDFDEQRIIGRKQTRWYEFVNNNNMILPKRDPNNAEFSHTLLSGGVLNVPVEQHAKLLMCLAKDIHDGFLPDFNEIAPPISRFYMDLDFKDKIVEGGTLQLFSKRTVKEFDNGNGTEKFPAITIEEEPLERRRLHNIMVASCIAHKVFEYFPNVVSHDENRQGVRDEETRHDETFHVHCMWRPSRFTFNTERYVNDQGQHVEETKVVARSFGMHLVWPNLYVTQEQALHLREGVIRALAAKFSKPGPNNRSQPGLTGWEDVVDEKVYLPAASMRMIFSDKYDTCSECVQRNLLLYGTKKAPVRARTSKATADDDEVDPFDDYRLQCVCHGSGKAPANSVYVYEATVDAAYHDWTKGYQKQFKKHLYYILSACCICDPKRPDLVRQKALAATDPVMQLPANAPRYPNFIPSSAASLAVNEQRALEYKEKVGKIAATVRQYADDNGQHVLLGVDTKEFTAIQNLFLIAATVQREAQWTMSGQKKRRSKKNIDPQLEALEVAANANGAAANVLEFSRYENLTVYRVRRGETNGHYYYLVDVVNNGLSSNASYCYNVQRHHNCEKNVYFKITESQGIVQKCLCWGSKDRFQACKNFESAPCALPKEAHAILYPLWLLQRGMDKRYKDVLIASGHRPSIISTAESVTALKQRARVDITRPFQIVAVDETDVELLNKYVEKKRKRSSNAGAASSHPSPEDSLHRSVSSHGPLEPLDARCIAQACDEALQESQDGLTADIDAPAPTDADANHIDLKTLQEEASNDAHEDEDGENQRADDSKEDEEMHRAVQKVLQPNTMHQRNSCKRLQQIGGNSNDACDCCEDGQPLTKKIASAFLESFSNNAYRAAKFVADTTTLLGTKQDTKARLAKKQKTFDDEGSLD